MKTFTESKTYGIFSTPANRKIIKDLEIVGAKVFQFPPFETESIVDADIHLFIKNNFINFDWIIFADTFTVDYFLEILEATKTDLFELDDKRILAFGEAVSDRLRFSQIHSDVIPNSIETEKIFLALVNYLELDELSKANFLFPKFVGYETALKNYLHQAGAGLTEFEIYKIKCERLTEIAKLKALLTGGTFDEFIFNSPEDVFFLQRYLFPKRISDILSEIQASAPNEITMQTLRENNLIPTNFKPN